MGVLNAEQLVLQESVVHLLVLVIHRTFRGLVLGIRGLFFGSSSLLVFCIVAFVGKDLRLGVEPVEEVVGS